VIQYVVAEGVSLTFFLDAKKIHIYIFVFTFDAQHVIAHDF
jgi:hypothetical protein